MEESYIFGDTNTNMIKKLCIFLIVIAGVVEETKAQVVYVNVNVNNIDSCTCVAGNNYAADTTTWDLDNNGINDFSRLCSSNTITK